MPAHSSTASTNLPRASHLPHPDVLLCAADNKQQQQQPPVQASSSLPALGAAAGAGAAGPESGPSPARPRSRGNAEHIHARQLIAGLNVKAPDGAWQTVPKNEWEVDRPAMRADTGDLTYGFQLAMDVADRSKGHPDASKKSKGAEDDSGTLK